MASAPTLADAGVTDVMVTLRAFARDPADGPAALDAIASAFAAAVGR